MINSKVLELCENNKIEIINIGTGACLDMPLVFVLKKIS